MSVFCCSSFGFVENIQFKTSKRTSLDKDQIQKNYRNVFFLFFFLTEVLFYTHTKYMLTFSLKDYSRHKTLARLNHTKEGTESESVAALHKSGPRKSNIIFRNLTVGDFTKIHPAK